MHSTNLPPAGKAISVDTTRPEGVYLTARIVEPGAVKLVKEGVYSAFSVGISKPRIVRDKVAKQGRVTDGIFSEVSIVDFPALPTAKFSIVKRSKTEIKKLEKTLTPIGTIVKSQSDEKGQESVELEKSKADNVGGECDVCKGAGCEKCMGKAAEPEVEKGKVPEVDEKVTEDLETADEAIHDAQEAQSEDNAMHVAGDGDDDDDDDDDDTVEKSAVEGVAYGIRRAHDAICEAYSATTIATAHPSVEKNGYKAVLEPGVIRSLLSSIAENGEPEQIAALAKAVGAATTLSTMSDDEIVRAHNEINKAFSDAYPTAHPTPGSITPGQFQRTFIGTGRAPLSSTGAAPRIPVSNSEIDGDDFTRGPLTAGRESASPENTGSQVPTNATAADRIAEATADVAMNAITALHDHIASAYPTICSLDNGAGFSGAGVQTLNNDGSIQHIAAGAVPSLTKAEKKLLKQAKKLKKAQKLVAKAEKNANIVEDQPIVKAVTTTEGDVLLDTDRLSEIVKSLIEQHVQDKFSAIDDVLSVVKADVEKLGSQPDPAKAPVRGTVVLERAVEKSATQADVLRKTAEDSLKEQVTYLRELTKSGNPELRMRAESQLASLLEKVSFETEE